MEKIIDYTTKGTCSRAIHLVLNDGVITDAAFVGGCSGNTQGVASLVIGMTAEKAIEKLKGIKCGSKSTSCPDQLAQALEEALAE